MTSTSFSSPIHGTISKPTTVNALLLVSSLEFVSIQVDLCIYMLHYRHHQSRQQSLLNSCHLQRTTTSSSDPATTTITTTRCWWWWMIVNTAQLLLLHHRYTATSLNYATALLIPMLSQNHVIHQNHRHHQKLRRPQQYNCPTRRVHTTSSCHRYVSFDSNNDIYRSVDTNDSNSSNLLDDLLNEVLQSNVATTALEQQPQEYDNGKRNSHDDNRKSNNGWRRIDWNGNSTTTISTTQQQQTPIPPPSPIDIVMIRDRLVYIKRDDQTRLVGSQISGNKARKMWSLHCMESTNFPECIVSFGGPQSNSMLAIAAVVQYHNTQLEQLYKKKSSGNSKNKNDDDDDSDSTIPNLIDNGDGDDDYDDDLDDDDRVKSTEGQPSQQQPFQRRRFIYYTKTLPTFLRNQPSGNLFRAISLGMEIVEISNEQYNHLFASNDNTFISHNVAPMQLQPPVHDDSVWIPQGGACSMAVVGTERMAQEIYDYWYNNGNNQPLSVCIPGGTCSTALFVHRAIQAIQTAKPILERLDIEIVVIPCVGDDMYAQRQMINLNTHIFGTTSSCTKNGDDNINNNNYSSIPTILRPTASRNGGGKLPWQQRSSSAATNSRDNSNDYFRFGEPNADILQTFRELRDEYDIVVDLLYGAPSWTILFRHWTSSSSTTTPVTPKFNPNAPMDGRRIMYIHSGGVEGINSQLLRYKHKNLIDIDEIQLPGRQQQHQHTIPP